MRLDDGLDDGKSETQAHRAVIGPRRWFEEPGSRTRWQADAAVGYLTPDGAAAHIEFELDSGAGCAELAGIENQVNQYLRQPRAIAHDIISGSNHLQRLFLAGQQWLDSEAHVSKKIRDLQWFAAQFQLTSRRMVHQVVDENLQAASSLLNRRKHIHELLAIQVVEPIRDQV